MRKDRGFTLIELMIAVAIIGVLSAVAVPIFAQTIRKSHEATTLGNLGAIRSALSVYYSDTEGQWPQDALQSLTNGSKYLPAIPIKYTPPYHPAGNDVGGYADFSSMTTAREDWYYVNSPGSASFGNIVVNCDHRDNRGNIWSTY